MIKQLVSNELIITDRMTASDVEWDDSVRVLAAGWVHLRLLSERFEYLFGVIPTTPIRDHKVAQELAELVKIESERGELQFYQKVRAVEIFWGYLWKERQALITPFNEGRISGADYVLSHIGSALAKMKNRQTSNASEGDILDF
jgi:hypothetical protein